MTMPLWQKMMEDPQLHGLSGSRTQESYMIAGATMIHRVAPAIRNQRGIILYFVE